MSGGTYSSRFVSYPFPLSPCLYPCRFRCSFCIETNYATPGTACLPPLEKMESLAKNRKPADLTEPLEFLSDTKKLVDGVRDMMGAASAQ